MASDCKRFDGTQRGNLEPASCIADLADNVLHPHQDRQKLGIVVEGTWILLPETRDSSVPEEAGNRFAIRNLELCWNELDVDSRRLCYTQNANQYALREDYRSLPESSGSASFR